MTHHSGRHFLQIPGPTNVPDSVLRAIDCPTMDHRGPEFGALGRRVLEGIKGIGEALAELLGPHEIRRDWVWPNIPPAWVHHVRVAGD